MSGTLELWYVWRASCGYGCADEDEGFSDSSCGHGKESGEMGVKELRIRNCELLITDSVTRIEGR